MQLCTCDCSPKRQAARIVESFDLLKAGAYSDDSKRAGACALGCSGPRVRAPPAAAAAHPSSSPLRLHSCSTPAPNPVHSRSDLPPFTAATPPAPPPAKPRASGSEAPTRAPRPDAADEDEDRWTESELSYDEATVAKPALDKAAAARAYSRAKPIHHKV